MKDGTRMRRFVGMMGVAAAVAGLVGCGTPAATVPATAESRALQTLPATVTQVAPLPEAESQLATAPITYRNARYPLHSDRFEFKSGTFQPIDDGMGPRGDVSFFYNGEQFYVIVNAHAGSDRAIAPQAATTYQQGPLPIAPGARYTVRTPDGTASIEIERLDAGTMRLTPEAGSGSGAVVFRYHFAG